MLFSLLIALPVLGLAADNGGKWASGNINYTCVAEAGFNLNEIAGKSTVDTLADVRGEQPVLQWLRNTTAFDTGSDEVQEYGMDLIIFVAPGIVMCAVTFWLFISCCCSHVCCPSTCRKCCKCCPACCACGPQKRLEDYTKCEKRTPHGCFCTWSLAVVVCCLMGIAAFGTVGEGLQKTGCAVDNLIDDSRGFVHDFEQPMLYISTNALAIINDAETKANDTATIDAGMSAHLGLVGSLVSHAKTESSRITGSLASVLGTDPAATDLSGYDATSIHNAMQASADTAIDKLESVEVEVKTYLAEPKQTMVDLSDEVKKITSDLYDTLDDAKHKVSNATVTKPAWIPGVFLSGDEYAGYNAMLTDARENIYFWGMLFFVFQLLALPMLVLGDVMTLCSQPAGAKRTGSMRSMAAGDARLNAGPLSRKKTFRDHFDRSCANKCGVCCLRSGCCFLVLGCFFCFFFSSIVLGATAVYSDVCVVVDDFPTHIDSYSFLVNSNSSGTSTSSNSSAANLNMEPADILEACFAGDSLIAKLNLTSSYSHIIENGLNFTSLDSVDIDAAFDFREWAEINSDIANMSPATFGWSQADFDKLNDACTNCANFGDAYAVLGLSGSNAPNCDGVCSSQVQLCGTTAGGCTSSGACTQQKVCDFRDSMAQAKTDILALQVNLVGRAAAVNASELTLKGSVNTFKTNLLSVKSQTEPLLAKIQALSNTTYCGFIETHYDAVDDGICNLTLSGLFNTSVLMFLAAFFSIPVIWCQMLVETRVAGVGQTKSFRQQTAWARKSFHGLARRLSRGRMGGDGGGANGAANGAGGGGGPDPSNRVELGYSGDDNNNSAGEPAVAVELASVQIREVDDSDTRAHAMPTSVAGSFRKGEHGDLPVVVAQHSKQDSLGGYEEGFEFSGEPDSAAATADATPVAHTVELSDHK